MRFFVPFFSVHFSRYLVFFAINSSFFFRVNAFSISRFFLCFLCPRVNYFHFLCCDIHSVSSLTCCDTHLLSPRLFLYCTDGGGAESIASDLLRCSSSFPSCSCIVQTAVVRKDFETANSILPSIPKTEYTAVARFLETQGFKEEAFQVRAGNQKKSMRPPSETLFYGGAVVNRTKCWWYEEEKYAGFCVYRRSYLVSYVIWSPVIEDGRTCPSAGGNSSPALATRAMGYNSMAHDTEKKSERLSVVRLRFALFLPTRRRMKKNSTHPFRTVVPLWEQTTQFSSSLSPKRDCGLNSVEGKKK